MYTSERRGTVSSMLSRFPGRMGCRGYHLSGLRIQLALINAPYIMGEIVSLTAIVFNSLESSTFIPSLSNPRYPSDVLALVQH